MATKVITDEELKVIDEALTRVTEEIEVAQEEIYIATDVGILLNEASVITRALLNYEEVVDE